MSLCSGGEIYSPGASFTSNLNLNGIREQNVSITCQLPPGQNQSEETENKSVDLFIIAVNENLETEQQLMKEGHPFK